MKNWTCGALIGPLLAVACAEEPVESKTAPPLESTPPGTTVTCDGTEPVLESVSLGNAGMVTGDDGDMPGFAIGLHITDADGDLHRVAADIWFDDVLDGAVDATGEPQLFADYFDTNEEACTVFNLDFSLAVGVNGTDLAYNTAYEVVAVVIDDAGLRSNSALGMGYTPNEDGSDGG